MSRKTENNEFICVKCSGHVKAIAKGTVRNHCPYCLHSVHVDIIPGDRESTCRGLMEPAYLKMHSKKGYQVIHKCQECGHQQHNILADDDNFDLLLTLDYH